MEIKAKIWLTDSGVKTLARGEVVKDYELGIDGDNCDMTTHGWVLLKEVLIPVDQPIADYVVPAAIGHLRRAVTEFRAEAEVKAQRMEAEIQNLLSIEHSA